MKITGKKLAAAGIVLSLAIANVCTVQAMPENGTNTEGTVDWHVSDVAGVKVKGEKSEERFEGEDGEAIFVYTVTKPVITLDASAEVQADLNRVIDIWVSSMKHTAEEYKAAALEHYKAVKAEGREMYTYEFAQDYAVIWNNGRLLNFEFDTYDYLGGAHGYLYAEKAAFDTANGQLAAIETISDQPEQLIACLRESAIRQIKESQDLREAVFEGFEDTIRTNELNAAPEKDGIGILFNQYEIAPYSAGPIRVLVSYDECGQYLNEYGRGLIGR